MIHETPHKHAGKTVSLIQENKLEGATFEVEDWWDRVSGMPWVACTGNPACIQYALRVGPTEIPTDNEVVYGKIGRLGLLVHESEIKVED